MGGIVHHYKHFTFWGYNGRFCGRDRRNRFQGLTPLTDMDLKTSLSAFVIIVECSLCLFFLGFNQRSVFIVTIFYVFGLFYLVIIRFLFAFLY